MKSTAIIQASSRSEGNTKIVVDALNKDNRYDVIDLATKKIGHYSYEYKNEQDDFIPLMKEIIAKYNTIIFATPVYWYTMSGTLKVFLDRFSDLIRIHKDLGRELRGKKMAMISNSYGNDRRDGFNMPFIESAKYLGMEYIGDVHAFFNEDEIHEEAKQLIDTFRNTILK